MHEALAGAWELANRGDIGGLMRHLRVVVDELALTELAALAGHAAGVMSFTDLANASQAVVADAGDPQALFDFGWACIERGVPFMAIPALREALRLAPAAVVVRELVAALAGEELHAQALTVLTEHAGILEAWPDGYSLAWYALLSGQVEAAERQLARLGVPEEPQWSSAYVRMERMLRRARAASAVGKMDLTDLRGWHYALTGGVLAILSPYGFAAGMTGRFAYLGESMSACRTGLQRLADILKSGEISPSAVMALPDRSSEIVGRAAARVLGLPFESFAADRAGSLVIAYDLTATDDDAVEALRRRVDGQIVYEHATCWTEPPAISADICGLLRQSITTPWGERMRYRDGKSERVAADERAVEAIAEELAAAELDEMLGDGETPLDDAGVRAEFLQAVRATWLIGERDAMPSAGPVRSGRFR